MLAVVLRYLLMSTLVLLGRSENVNFPGVVEQIRTNRQNRVSREFMGEHHEYIPVKTITSDPTKAPAEDAAEHLRELIHVNPDTLTAQQRRLLEQIVDRVARYGGLMVTNKIPVESNGDEDAQPRAHPTRSGNRNKTKSTTTKRPSSVMATKTVQKQSTSSASAAQSASTASLNQSATIAKATHKPLTRQKLKPPSTTDPTDYAHITTVTPSDAPIYHDAKTTSATSRHTVKPSEISLYDYNVTASALIESLSKPNSVAYQQRIRLPAPSASTHHHHQTPAATNTTKTKLQVSLPIDSPGVNN